MRDYGNKGQREKKKAKKEKKMTRKQEKCVEITQSITNITRQHKKPSNKLDITETIRSNKT